MFEERRQHQRLAPNAPQLVLLDESKYSLLFDLGEGGLAVEGYSAPKSVNAFPLEFDLPEGNGSIQAKGEIVWTSDSGYRTGFRFVELADNYREQLRAWISSASATRPAVVALEERTEQAPDALPPNPPLVETPLVEPIQGQNDRNKQVVEFHTDGQLFAVPKTPKLEVESSEKDKSGALAGIRSQAYWPQVLLAALTLCCVSFLGGYYWRGLESPPRASQAPAAAQSATTAHSSAAQNQGAAAEPAPSPAPSAKQAGFVLQVAAMEKQANADALSTTLQEKNFPAFVLKRTGDRFYRVVVGPYPKQEASGKIRHDLEAQGFPSELRPWSPQ